MLPLVSAVVIDNAIGFCQFEAKVNVNSGFLCTFACQLISDLVSVYTDVAWDPHESDLFCRACVISRVSLSRFGLLLLRSVAFDRIALIESLNTATGLSFFIFPRHARLAILLRFLRHKPIHRTSLVSRLLPLHFRSMLRCSNRFRLFHRPFSKHPCIHACNHRNIQ